MNTIHKTISLPSKPLTIPLKSTSEYYDKQTKTFLMVNDSKGIYIPVSFNGPTASLPSIQGTGSLTIYFTY